MYNIEQNTPLSMEAHYASGIPLTLRIKNKNKNLWKCLTTNGDLEVFYLNHMNKILVENYLGSI